MTWDTRKKIFFQRWNWGVLELMTTIQPKIRQTFWKHQQGVLDVKILKRNPPRWYRVPVTQVFLVARRPENQSRSSRVVFLFQLSWILVSKKPGPSQVVAMVTFMDTTRIQVHHSRWWPPKKKGIPKLSSSLWFFEFLAPPPIIGEFLERMVSKSCEVGDMACHQICWIFDHAIRILTPPMETPDPPNDTLGP